jgi:hypothetical protein
MVQIGSDKIDTSLQMTLLKTNSFLSGIPFYSKTPVNFNTPLMKNFLKLNENTFYIPYNTISESCAFYSSMIDTKEAFSKIKCSLNNSNGTNMLVIAFKTNNNSSMEQHKMLFCQQYIEKGRNSRKNFITSEFENINNAAYDVSYVQDQITMILKSEAEVKAAKEATIQGLKVKIASLTIELATARAKKVKISNDLQSVKTSASDIRSKIKANIAIKISLLTTIEVLKTKITGTSIIDQMTKKQESDMTFLKYWLNGSVYHRVISESEMTALITMAGEKTSFVGKVNDS